MGKKCFMIIPLLIILIRPNCHAQVVTGGGNLNPGLHAHEGSLERFQDLRIGLSIHWGPSSLGGKEISWSRGEEIPKETYDNYYKSFNPVRFDAREWVNLAKAGGMKYILLTSKHHDGFCLWPSEFTDYNISNTPFERDIVKELGDACQKEGIMFGSYYSIIDWYHPDYHPYSHGGPGELVKAQTDSPNFERYLAFMKNQLKELVTDYPVEIIQFDGEWEPTWNHELGSDLYTYMRSLRNDLLINNRVDVGRQNPNPETGKWDPSIYAGDYEERERMVDWVEHDAPKIFGQSKIPWQAWVTIDTRQWSYNPEPNLLDDNEILIDLLKTIGDNGNYLINLGPRPDGSFDEKQVEIMTEVGNWLRKHEEAIYSTRGGPFVKENMYTSTIKDNTIYLFVLDGNMDTIEISLNTFDIESVSDYNGKRVKYKTSNRQLTIELPVSHKKGITVFKIDLS